MFSQLNKYGFEPPKTEALKNAVSPLQILVDGPASTIGSGRTLIVIVSEE